MYLLDQGIILALIEKNPNAINNVRENIEDCYIPAIVVAELYQINSPESKRDSIRRLMESFSVVEFGELEAHLYSEIQRELGKKSVAASVVDVMIAATALSLNATLITHRVKQFNIIRQYLDIDNWTKPDHVIHFNEREPGVLYRAAKLMRRLNINIIEAITCNELRDSLSTNYFSLAVDVPYLNIPEELKSILCYVDYEPFIKSYISTEKQQTKILFQCNFSLQSEQNNDNSNFHFVASGRDRVGLLADVTELIFEANIDIVTSACRLESIGHTNESRFYIRFDLNGDLNEDEWNSLLEKIRSIVDISEASYTVYNFQSN